MEHTIYSTEAIAESLLNVVENLFMAGVLAGFLIVALMVLKAAYCKGVQAIKNRSR